MEMLNGEGLLLSVLWSIGYAVKHKTRIPNTYIPFILFAVASALKYMSDALAGLIFGEAPSLSTIVWSIAYGIQYTFFACGGYEAIRAAKFTLMNRRKKENEMDLKKKPFVILLIAFLIASVVFITISLVFGSGLFMAFAKITDGWIYGILLAMAGDILYKLSTEDGKNRVTPTYIAMQVLLLINVISFSFASVTLNRMFSIVGLAISLFAGVSAGVLPFIVNAVKAKRAGNPDDGKALDEASIQRDWEKYRRKVMRKAPEERAADLEAYLAFRLIGDNIYGGIDLERPLLVGLDDDKTVAITVARAEGEKDFGVTAEDISDARSYIAGLLG